MSRKQHRKQKHRIRPAPASAPPDHVFERWIQAVDGIPCTFELVGIPAPGQPGKYIGLTTRIEPLLAPTGSD